ncbi:hypothetical protein SAMN02745196_02336 [Clostridium collagenovorans DSM 3089]|uniref:Uncharacterized protein n=1 Tax=Clostridium collagenovorans DSM 3089 TaxID=1121306 RepID=A0A1M5XN68_9CLOT|nr:hypothetical protein [Clostridium collagenovorans]SHI01295.1 hypothetical protein SAMN02745196_02336 [Clostridium collagenovorans DSM 3089]
MKVLGKELKLNGKDVALKENIPIKLSQLSNDMGFTQEAMKQVISTTQPSNSKKNDVWIHLI